MNITQIATTAARIAEYTKWERGAIVIRIEGAALDAAGKQYIHRYATIRGTAKGLRNITAEQVAAQVNQPETVYGETVAVSIWRSKDGIGRENVSYRV